MRTKKRTGRPIKSAGLLATGQFSLDLPPDLMRLVNVEAQHKRTSRASVIRYAIAKYFETTAPN